MRITDPNKLFNNRGKCNKIINMSNSNMLLSKIMITMNYNMLINSNSLIKSMIMEALEVEEVMSQVHYKIYLTSMTSMLTK
jgi:hypothetical protein